MSINKRIFCIILLLSIALQAYADVILSASKNEYFSKDLLNKSYSVLPILLEYEINSIENDFSSKKLILYKRLLNKDEFTASFSNDFTYPEFSNDFTEITQIELIPRDDNKILGKFCYYDSSFKPEEKYVFYAKLVTNNGKDFILSNPSIGYGALSYETFFKTVNKKIVYSHSKLVLMNKKSNMDKLGTEQCLGNISGNLSYKTKLEIMGLSGIVYMNYKDYSDFIGWIFNGSMNTRANIKEEGTMFDHLDIMGMYEGSIYYDNVIINKAKAGGGYYIVKLKDLDCKNIDYKLSFDLDN